MSRPRVRTAPEPPDHRAYITSMLVVLIGACKDKGRDLPARNHCRHSCLAGGSAVRRAGASVRPVAATERSK